MNGPPGSGKDESANHLVNKYGYKHTTFKEAAFDLVCAYNISMEEYLKLYNNRDTKEVPSELLDGKVTKKRQCNMWLKKCTNQNTVKMFSQIK